MDEPDFHDGKFATGFHDGKHFTEWVEEVRALKREKRYDEALTILAGCRVATAAESAEREWDRPAPFYWTEAAQILGMQGRFDEALAIFEDYYTHCSEDIVDEVRRDYEPQVQSLLDRRDEASFEGSAPVCPSCGVTLDEMPARSRKCAACGERIVRRTLNGEPLLLTEAEDEERKAATEQRTSKKKHIDLARRAEIYPEDLDRVAEELQARWGRTPNDGDVLWNALNQKLTFHMQSSNWAGLRQVYDVQTRVLAMEGKDWERTAALAVEADLMVLAGQVSRDEPLIMKGCACSVCAASRPRKTLAEAIESPGIPHVNCEKAPCKCYYVPERGYDAFFTQHVEVMIPVSVDVPAAKPSGLLGRLFRRA